MATLQGLVVFSPTILSKRGGSMCTFPVNRPFSRVVMSRSGFWGSQGGCRGGVKVLSPRRKPKVQFMCSFGLSSSGDCSMSEDFIENDEDYVNCSVAEAVEVKSGADGLLIQMQDDGYLRCAYNHPRAGHLPDYTPRPAFVLTMEDGRDLLLPIVALRRKVLVRIGGVEAPVDRSAIVEFMKADIEKEWEHSKIKLVRVTKRHEAYCAKIYFAKVGDDEARSIYLQRRPSLAIEIALRCKVPIQVNKHLAFSDGVRVVESSKLANHTTGVDKELVEDLWEEEEHLNLMKDMHLEIIKKRWMDILINPLPWLHLFLSSLVAARLVRSRIRRRKSTSSSPKSNGPVVGP